MVSMWDNAMTVAGKHGRRGQRDHFSLSRQMLSLDKYLVWPICGFSYFQKRANKKDIDSSAVLILVGSSNISNQAIRMMVFFKKRTILLPLNLFQIGFHRVKLSQCESLRCPEWKCWQTFSYRCARKPTQMCCRELSRWNRKQRKISWSPVVTCCKFVNGLSTINICKIMVLLKVMWKIKVLSKLILLC